ncbi:hypothetical protein CTEN210_01681 [Chaetoceros tenuissimus]|uniref:OTU domain-containing protein n=1 Tax=Chaetoceros tenuissimus TaxID=426638 RepID=A0AAD3CFL1_9STRA|nr:hypothetical protein CTEN210_01681 [Chaetoceros tenuissimus]
MEELQSKHKKELKQLETDKRIALKKVKGTAGKGKKGKEALAKAEQEWDSKLEELTTKHKNEIDALQGDAAVAEESSAAVEQKEETAKEPELSEEEKVKLAKEKALAKKLRKKKNKLAQEKAREEEIAREVANAPNPRQMEIDAIMELYLSKLNFKIEEVAADGNCLYRAVAKQMELMDQDFDYSQIRSMCADELGAKREDYEPFADLSDMKVDNFDDYVEKVRDSNEWGGHLELRALSHKLNKTIVVYSTEGPLEIKVEGQDDDEENVIRLSFHRNYYALGEHYNSVVKSQ